MEIMYFLILLTGAIFLFFILFTGEMARKRLKEKEREIIHLYESVENMLDEFQSLMRKKKNDLEKESTLTIESDNEMVGFQKMMEKATAAQKISSVSIQEEEGEDPQNSPRHISLKKQKIEMLLSKGRSVAEIAKEMKIGQGEVKLIHGMIDQDVASL